MIYPFIIKKDEKKTILYDETGKIELASYYDNNQIRSITINEEKCTKFSDEIFRQLINTLYFGASKDGMSPVCSSILVQNFIDINSNTLLVKDIEPIKYDGEIEIKDSNALNMYIELPVRGACQKLNKMGITTLMSSANREDVEKKDEPIDRYANFGGGQHFNLGNGYAWIMIDWETLTKENKQLLIALNNGSNSIPLKEQEQICLANNCKTNKVPISQGELIRFFEVFDYRIFSSGNRGFLNLPIICEEDASFDCIRKGYACINSLCNHGTAYRVAVLRYPIDENSTVSSVEEYFLSIIRKFSNQKIKESISGRN